MSGMRSVLVLGLPLVAVLAIGGTVLARPKPPAPSLETRAQLGIALCETGQPERGMQTLQGVLAVDPEQPQALVGLALAAMRDQRIAEAERLLEMAVKRDPDNFMAHLARAFLYRQRKESERARIEFEAAHKAVPREPAPVYNLGTLAFERGDLAGARTHYLEYLRLSPNAPDRAQVGATIEDLDRRLGTKTKP